MDDTKKDFKPEKKENDKGTHTTFRGLCKGCGICIEICPVGALSWDKENTGVYNQPSIKVDMDKCIMCGLCDLRCPDSAITVEKKQN